jgi:Ca-activated chloride channel family protein
VSFHSPFLLLTLLVLPLAVGLWLLAERRRMRYAVRFTNIEVLAAVSRSGYAWRRYVPPALFLLALATVCVGLARPHVKTLVGSERATVILVVDVSRSMEATDVKPTRLGAAQAAVQTFLDRAPKRLRVALIAFAGEPQVAAPPTRDHELVKTALDSIGYYSGFGGTAIGDALARAVELGQQATGSGFGTNGQTIAFRNAASGANRGLVSILFLSDGAQTRGQLEPLEGAQKAREAGFPVYTVALGSPNGRLRGNGFGGSFSRPVPPDPTTLRAIANTTGGQFFEARDAGTLQAAYKKLGSSLGRIPGKTEVTWEFLAAAAALLLVAGVLSALWAARLP